MAVVIDYFRKHSYLLKTEGLFRVPGRGLVIEQLHSCVKEGKSLGSLHELDAHCVGGLLKMLLRELAMPFFPYGR